MRFKTDFKKIETNQPKAINQSNIIYVLLTHLLPYSSWLHNRSMRMIQYEPHECYPSLCPRTAIYSTSEDVNMLSCYHQCFPILELIVSNKWNNNNNKKTESLKITEPRQCIIKRKKWCIRHHQPARIPFI